MPDNVEINVTQASIVPSTVDNTEELSVRTETEIPVSVDIESTNIDTDVKIQNSGIVNLCLTGGSTVEKDYNGLINKPKINGVTLIGDKSFPDLDLHTITDEELLQILT